MDGLAQRIAILMIDAIGMIIRFIKPARTSSNAEPADIGFVRRLQLLMDGFSYDARRFRDKG